MKPTFELARPFALPIALLVVHGVALAGLAALDVVARLLGAAADPPIGWVLALAGFYLLRVITFALVPGLLILATVQVVARVLTRIRARRSSRVSVDGPGNTGSA